MTNRLKRLELTWIGKDERPRSEPRILLEDEDVVREAGLERGPLRQPTDPRRQPARAEGVGAGVHGQDQVRLHRFAVQYGERVEHYDDGLEHSRLSLIRSRIEILWNLLSDDGSLWVSIDDTEVAYLRVVLDEVCGRASFVACNVWQKRYSRENREAIGDAHEYVIVYAKDPARFKQTRNKLPLGESKPRSTRTRTKIRTGRGARSLLSAQGDRPNQMYEIVSPSGKRHKLPAGSCWKVIEPKYQELLAEGRIYFGKKAIRNSTK